MVLESTLPHRLIYEGDFFSEPDSAIQNKSDQSSPIDYALLLRFDVVYYKPFSALNIDMTKVSLASRYT